jgi:CHAT domain-containing protein/tetratricopeptide (TPR) repeat protein
VRSRCTPFVAICVWLLAAATGAAAADGGESWATNTAADRSDAPAAERQREVVDALAVARAQTLRGESVRAIQTLRRAAAMTSTELQSSTMVVTVHFELAAAYLDIGEFERAETIIDAAVGRSGSGHVSTDQALQLREELLRLRILNWHDKPAEELRRRVALRARLEATFGPDAEATLENEILSGFAQADLGNAIEAHRIFEASLERARRILGPVHPLTVSVVVGLARAFDRESRSSDAERILIETIRDVAAAIGTDNYLYARLLRQLGAARMDAKPTEAIPPLEHAARWFEAALGKDSVQVAITLNNLAFAYGYLERVDEALVLQKQVLQTYQKRFGTDNNETIFAEHNLAAWLMHAGRSDEALPFLRDIDALSSRRSPADDDNRLTVRLNLANAMRMTGDVVGGCAYFDELLRDVARRSFTDRRRLEIEFGWAQCALARGEPAVAVTAFDSVYRRRRDIFGPDSIATQEALAILAVAYLALGRSADAQAALEDVVATAERQRAEETPQASGGRTWFASRVAGREYRGGYRDLAFLYAQQGRVADAIRITELGRARGIEDALSMRLAGGSTLLPDRDRLQLRQLDERLRGLDAEIALTPVTVPKRLQLVAEREAIAGDWKSMRRRVQASESGGARTELDLVRVAKRLPLGTVFIGYQLVRGRVWAFVIRRDAPPRAVVLPEAVDVAGAVTVLHDALGIPNAALAPLWRLTDGNYAGGLTRPAADATRASFEDVAKSLATSLLGPLADDLAGAKHLIITADGPLALLPFEVLPLRGRLLIDRVEVSYVPSLAVWQALQAAPRRAGRPTTELIAFGAPAYAQPDATTERLTPLSGRHWSPLPGAAREVRSVAAMFPADRQRAYIGAEASETNFQALNRSGALANTRYLLLAVHGVLSPAAPQWSALILSEANRNTEPNGFVTAAELATYELGSDLTVLSACETGLGKEVAGEGIFGLPFALFVAGSRRTVLTLWPVADEATAQFIERLFAKLKRGIAPARALAATKREFRRDPRHSAPFYWAPFVLYGD